MSIATSATSKLMDPNKSQTRTDSSAPEHWAVVGGGMLGLATARKLLARGHRVTLLESGNQLGGLTSAWQLGDVVWDRFYHVILMSDTRLRSLLNELQLDDEIEWVQTRTGFYAGGRLHSLSNSIEFLRFPILNLWQKFRLGSTIFFGSKIRDWKSMEQLSVEAWLRRWSGHSTYQKIWLPLLKSKLGETYQRASAAFIWAYIDRMYKARRSGMKREMFGYVPGGYQRILEALADETRQAGATIRSGARVENISRRDADQPLEVTYRTGGHQQTETFDRVVMTVPSPIISNVCPQLSEKEHEQLNAVEYIGVVCTSLLLKQPLGGYYVTNITDPGIPLTGIIEMGAIVKPEKLGGHYLVYLPQYLPADDPRLDEPDSSIHARCIATLKKMYPNFHEDQITAIQTARAKYVMALPTLHYSQQRPPVISSMPGLYLLNSARIVKGNLNVNETLELLEEEFDQLCPRVV